MAFKKLLAERGVVRASGATNRHTSTCATVALVAEELGVPERTAKHRMSQADKLDVTTRPSTSSAGVTTDLLQTYF